jgi:glycosyltransferase involved in cell wall biosynthesis
MKGYYFVNTDLSNRKGHSIQIMNTVGAVNKAGINLEIVAPKYQESYNLDKIHNYYGTVAKFPINLLYTPFSLAQRWSFIFFIFSSIVFLLGKRLSGEVDFIYFRSEYLLPLAIFGHLLGLPFYYEVHRIGLSGKSVAARGWLAKHAKGLVVLTEVLKKYFDHLNNNIHVAHDAVHLADFANNDCSQEEARKRLGLRTAGPILSYVGSIKRIKGTDIILSIAEQFPDVEFYLVGYVEESYKSVFDNLPKNVHLVGQYTREENPLWLKASDLLLITHPDNPQSQSPMKLFEYMASGKPVISSDLPNIREVLPENNIFFEPDDAGQFCLAIKQYIKNREYYVNVGKQNREKVKEYSWDERGGEIAEFISNLHAIDKLKNKS